ncbi:hypothetical protein B0T18DRAFT_434432 [Schizothecium vesticola]|uniref:Uncharacterized protein n=1 Tax=Schizothecium vesticola TaxID=314040 RepID=A0AA40KCJ4_9PEZI|nr:hypothetical protein B0T18DRAFT_434432 [Schizothecium vesticola]
MYLPQICIYRHIFPPPYRGPCAALQTSNPDTGIRTHHAPPPPPHRHPPKMSPRSGRITFLAALKVSTIFVCSFFTLIALPSYIQAGESYSLTASLFLCGLIPLVYVAYTTAPFVTAVHLQLPPFARSSTELLRRFAASPPAAARLEVGTLSFFGTPRVTTLTVADLRPVRERWGMVNFVRDNAAAARKARKWWHLPVVDKFNMQEGNEGRVKAGWVWKELEGGIRRRAAQGGGGGR